MLTLIHASGDMFAPASRRHQMYRQVAASGADVFTFSEAAEDHAFLRSLPGIQVAMAAELVIGWRTDTMRRVGAAASAKVMQGGKHGPLGSTGSTARRGPNRYGLEQVLEEIATSRRHRIGTHHAIAKADTSFLWRRRLRRLGFRNFAALLRRTAAGDPSIPRIVTGDWNTKGTVDLGLGLREVATPGTFGRLRYDRVQVSPGLFTSRPLTARTPLDHRCVIVAVSHEAHPPLPRVALHTDAAAPPNPFRPGWRRRRRRHPRLFRRAVRRWRAFLRSTR